MSAGSFFLFLYILRWDILLPYLEGLCITFLSVWRHIFNIKSIKPWSKILNEALS